MSSDLAGEWEGVWSAVARLPEATAFQGPFDEAALAALDYVRRIAPARVTTLSDVRRGLDNRTYHSTAAFLEALRSVSLNALRFNSTDDDGHRSSALACLDAVDDAVAVRVPLLRATAAAGRPFVRALDAFPEARAAAAALEWLLHIRRKAGQEDKRHPWFSFGSGPGRLRAGLASRWCFRLML